MKTDHLFYEVFQLQPQALLQLASLEVQGEYRFQSITLKQMERRLDGFFRDQQGKAPHVFVEVQGYEDSQIAWRMLNAISSYYLHNANEKDHPFVAVILFLNHKPSRLPFALPEECFKLLDLEECLATLGEAPSILTIFKPLVLKNTSTLNKQIAQWTEAIQTLPLPANQTKHALDLLEYAILQRFPQLTLGATNHDSLNPLRRNRCRSRTDPNQSSTRP